MAMTAGPTSGGDEDEMIASINTTPLVDVMLVLLIIFLLTIPLVTHTVPVELPKERNVVTQTKPENVLISVNRDGDVFWGQEPIGDNETLVDRLKKVSVMAPQPEVHIRGDQEARYQSIGRVVFDAQRAGIRKIGFITEPPPLGG
jgi:biopolymer transport protein ExbD